MRKIVLFLLVVVCGLLDFSCNPSPSGRQNVRVLKIDTLKPEIILSSGQIVEYWGQISPDTFFVVFRHPSPDSSYYESFRCQIGVANKMQELNVLEVLRFRDGGTTSLFLEDPAKIKSDNLFGKKVFCLNFPSPFYKDSASTFNSRPLYRRYDNL